MAIPSVPRAATQNGLIARAGSLSFTAGVLGAGSIGSYGSLALGGSAGSSGSMAAIGSGAKPFTSELDGEYTCEEIEFEITDRIIAHIYGYKPDPNAPAPQVFLGNADRPLEGINLAGAGSAATGPASPAGEINTKILQAALAAYNEKMSSRSGPGGGNVACAWAVNQVMTRAGLPPIGPSNPNYVDTLESDLKGGRGQLVDRAAIQPGDIVVMGTGGGNAHIGIAIGPDKIVSNSSRNRNFSWVASLATYDQWYKAPCRVYRVVR